MTFTAKRLAKWLIGCVLIAFALGVLGVEVWHQHAISLITASVAVPSGILGGLLVAPNETRANIATIIGWVRELFRGKNASV